LTRAFTALSINFFLEENLAISNDLSSKYSLKYSFPPKGFLPSKYRKGIGLFRSYNFVLFPNLVCNGFCDVELSSFDDIHILNFFTFLEQFCFVLARHFSQIVEKSLDRIPINFFK
jgi:hypothetical protein